ncbi:RES domain-containing protein [Tardiphaga alba]|uniref:RES domain-containing protein n=1 Tax=Tardiphaga alba TaxID=340268 RepID=A0ABX8AD30_9BRAD|nr:RES family NAD+ phosphorylase [Tardiphaga alba]QUS41211.1 RES domain-containing protein [Tardiphaga alba]
MVPKARHFTTYEKTVWRMVEAQHRISTNRLVADADDQALLERLVDQAKPPLPATARHLHYLLATPFRYGYAKSSRFRRARERPGIFYASEDIATSVAETAYWRLLFFSRSPDFKPPSNTVKHSAFTVPLKIERALDLTAKPFVAHTTTWMHPTDYTACQDFATQARRIDAQLIRYASVRAPDHRANLALLDPSGFARTTPTIEQTWHFRFEAGTMTAYAAMPSDQRYRYSMEQFGISAS